VEGQAVKKCERCGAGPRGEYDLLDYCAKCLLSGWAVDLVIEKLRAEVQP
jgi:hypothetical protein